MWLAGLETYSTMILPSHIHLLREMEWSVERSGAEWSGVEWRHCGHALWESLQGRELNGTLQLINHIAPQPREIRENVLLLSQQLC